MTKKRNVISTGFAIIGIVLALFLLPNFLFSWGEHTITGFANEEEAQAAEMAFQQRLLEYAEFGLYFDEETRGFFYNEQRVRILVDTPSYYRYDDGIGEITITRNSEGEIIEFNVSQD